MKKKTILYALHSTIPVLSGYIVLGIGFGVLLHTKGYGWPWALLMSILMYAGSMQYVAVDLLAAGASLITSAIITVMVNIRHVFYGVAMLGKYKVVKKTKPYLIFALTDETFSLVCTSDLPQDIDKELYYFTVSLANHLYWIAGGVIGNVLGDIIPFNTAGIEFAMTALFVVIFITQWESTKDHVPALIGALVSAVSLLLFGPDKFLIPSMCVITVGLFCLRAFRARKKGGGSDE